MENKKKIILKIADAIFHILLFIALISVIISADWSNAVNHCPGIKGCW